MNKCLRQKAVISCVQCYYLLRNTRFYTPTFSKAVPYVIVLQEDLTYLGESHVTSLEDLSLRGAYSTHQVHTGEHMPQRYALTLNICSARFPFPACI